MTNKNRDTLVWTIIIAMCAIVILAMTTCAAHAQEIYTNASLNQPAKTRPAIREEELAGLRAHAFQLPQDYPGPIVISTGSTSFTTDLLPTLSPTPPQPWAYINGWPIYATDASYPPCYRCAFHPAASYRAFGMRSQSNHFPARVDQRMDDRAANRAAQSRRN